MLWEENSLSQRSIASITKVMTAAVFLEDRPTSRAGRRPAVDVYRASTTYLRAGYKVTTDDLLHLLLIGVRQRGGPGAGAHVAATAPTGFVAPDEREGRRARARARDYADPSGLLNANVSSAYDMARLIAMRGQTNGSADDHAEGAVQRRRRPPDASRVISTNQLVKEGGVDVGGQDRIHPQVGLLPGRAAALAAGRRSGGGRARRQVERGTLLGNATLFNWLAGQGPRLSSRGPRSKPPPPSDRSARVRLTPASIPPLYRRRVERQRGDPIHDRHDRPRRPPRVDTPSGSGCTRRSVDTVLTVRRRERCDARRGRSCDRTGTSRLEPPSKRAPPADQVPFRRRRDHGEIRFAAAQRAIGMRPGGKFAAAAAAPPRNEKERTHRQHE